MTESIGIGTAVVLAGGVMTGLFALPMRFARRWAWENIWLLYSVFGLIAVPWIAALLTVPNLFPAYAAAGGSALAVTVLFGFGWGIANVLFGRSVALIGMAMTFAIVGGLSASCGSLLPLLVINPARLATTGGRIILLGVALTICGVALLGVAGRRREAATREQGVSQPMRAGLLPSVAAGLLGPMLNYSFVFGEPIAQQAIRQGAASGDATNAIWALAFLGGFAGNGGYAVLRLSRNRTWDKFRNPGLSIEWILGALTGVLFTAGFLSYGRGARALGELGPAVGWPVFQATTMIASTIAGAATGEWRQADRSVVVLNLAGLAILISAIVALSFGNRM